VDRYRNSPVMHASVPEEPLTRPFGGDVWRLRPHLRLSIRRLLPRRWDSMTLHGSSRQCYELDDVTRT